MVAFKYAQGALPMNPALTIEQFLSEREPPLRTLHLVGKKVVARDVFGQHPQYERLRAGIQRSLEDRRRDGDFEMDVAEVDSEAVLEFDPAKHPTLKFHGVDRERAIQRFVFKVEVSTLLHCLEWTGELVVPWGFEPSELAPAIAGTLAAGCWEIQSEIDAVGAEAVMDGMYIHSLTFYAEDAQLMQKTA